MVMGAAMLASLAIGGLFGDDEMPEDVVDDEDINEPDLVAGILGGDDEGDQDGSVDGGPASAFPDIVFSDLDEVHWDTEDFQSLSPDELAENSINTAQAVYVADTELADNIDVSAWTHAIVYSGEGDTVIGGNDHPEGDQFAVISSGGSVVDGGDGDGVFVALNDGNLIRAGAGDDLLVSDSGAAHLDGGEGDDTIFAYNSDWVTPSATSRFEDYADTGIDTVSGGAGNDVIVASSGDIVNSGTGSDEIFLFGYHNSVQDFEVGSDRIISFLPEELSAEGAALPIQNELFELIDDDAMLQIQYDGESVLSLPNTSDLNIAFSNQSNLENLIYILRGDSAYDGADSIFLHYPTVES
jgi:Ca2+-binding RTX toxin-like protein